MAWLLVVLEHLASNPVPTVAALLVAGTVLWAVGRHEPAPKPERCGWVDGGRCKLRSGHAGDHKIRVA